MNQQTIDFRGCIEPLYESGEEIRKISGRLKDNLSKAPAVVLKEYIRWAWKNHLHPHLNLALNIIDRFTGRSHYLYSRIEDNKEEFQELIDSVEREFSSWTLDLLCRRLDHYIRFGETELFPFLEKNLAFHDLPLLEEMIRSAQKKPVDWPERFWE